MRRITFFVIVFLLLSSFAFAQEYTVEYIDGYADIKDGGDWYELYIGDVLGPSDTVSLEAGSILQLAYGGNTITLTKPGVYNMSSIDRQARIQSSSGVDSLIGNKLASLVGSGDVSEVPISAVGGVRGADAGSANDFGWIESEVDEIIKSGLNSMAAGDVETALDLFCEAYDYALDEEEEAVSLFYIGYAHDILGEPVEALESLEDVYTEANSEIYTDFYLLKGKLQIQTYDFEQAVSFLQEYDDTYASPQEKQTVYFLTGIAYDGLEEKHLADDFFQRAYTLDPDSEVGKTSNRMLTQ